MVTALFLFKGLNALIWLSYSYFYMFDQDKLLRSHGMGYDLASKEGKLAVSLMKSMGKLWSTNKKSLNLAPEPRCSSLPCGWVV